MENKQVIFTFESTHSALRFEKTIKENNLYIRLIPVPREISTSCGIAAKINEGDIKAITEICRENELDFNKIYRVIENKQPELIVHNLEEE